MTGDEGERRRTSAPTDESLADVVLGLLDEAEARRVAATAAADPTVARRLAAMRRALDALAIDLEPAEPPAGGLERLLGEARSANDGKAEGAAAPRRTVTAQGASSPRRTPTTEGASTPGRAVAASAPPPRRPWRASAWVAATLVVALVALAGTFATLQAGAVAQVREDQRVLAYWMGNPGMTLVSLEAPPGTDDGAWDGGDGAVPTDPTGRLGVVCLLPDGRGLVLRPSPAPNGAWYQVVGSGPDGDVELARSAGTLLTFDATGIERVEVRVLGASRSGIAGALDRVVLLLGGRPAVPPGGIGDGAVVAQAHLP